MVHPDRRNPYHPDLNLSNLLILSTMAEEYRVGGHGLLQAANLVLELSTESIDSARHGGASPKARAAKDGAASAAPVGSVVRSMCTEGRFRLQHASGMTGLGLANRSSRAKPPSSLVNEVG